MFCPKCGEKNVDGAKFCGGCGAPMGPAAAPAAVPTPTPPARPASGRTRALVAAAALVVAAGVAGALAWLVFFSPFEIDDKTFPDSALRAAVSAFDADGDGRLSRDEGRAVTRLALSGASELSGLGRFFPNLEELEVTGGQLASLDVGDLPKLAALAAREEPLAELDLSGNASLSSLVVPDGVRVSGLDATGLREEWLLAEVVETMEWAAIPHSARNEYVAAYDDAGRVVARELRAESDSGLMQTVESWAYAYDEAGRLSEERESTSLPLDDRVTRYAYDGQGRLSSASSSFSGMSIESYSYDGAGRLAEVTFGGENSGSYRYAYDGEGRLASVEQVWNGSATTTSYSYDARGNCVEKSVRSVDGDYESDSVTSYELDADGRPVRVWLTSSDEILASANAPVSFAYDDQGRIVSASALSGGQAYEVAVSYDELGRMALVEEVESKVESEDDWGRKRTYAPTYTRRFVAEGQPAASGLAVTVPVRPLPSAQAMQLSCVCATPDVRPDPEPYPEPSVLLWLL